MSSITYEERWTHPTTADVYGGLDVEHCDRCETWSTGLQAWWSDPNSVQGCEMLDAIGAHILAEYPTPTSLTHSVSETGEKE